MKPSTPTFTWICFIVGFSMLAFGAGLYVQERSFDSAGEKNNVEFGGLRWEGNESHREALELAYGYSKGNWICVNVIRMDIEKAFDTCKHEVGHEIFASVCADDFDKCLELMNDTDSVEEGFRWATEEENE